MSKAEQKQEGIIKDADIYLQILKKRIKHPVRKQKKLQLKQRAIELQKKDIGEG